MDMPGFQHTPFSTSRAVFLVHYLRGFALKYDVVIGKSHNVCSAYLPDLPGCIAAGDTVIETEDLIRQVVIYHL